ncbi:hypothetical protein [Sinorhizobium meliloti]|uniref:hypothetical protein n=1 Tax=Rhizobium meliloti TaxID=382 RepID=UPI0003DD680B|nr:hypothetical protein [Sinorhizobium meliloti]ARS71083.1 hypothetical protein SMRU11_29455 [Sinorhizobium meliloti RU11/001]
MKTQTFWTILPNGIVDGKARLSVFVTPKLLGSAGDLHALTDYPDMFGWPDIVKGIGFRLHARTSSAAGNIGPIAAGSVFHPVNGGELGLDRQVWSHIFQSRPILVEPELTDSEMAVAAKNDLVGVRYRAAMLDRIVSETQIYHMMLSLTSPGEEPAEPSQGTSRDRLVEMAERSEGSKLELHAFPLKEGQDFFYRPARAVTNFFRENLDGNGSATVEDLQTNDRLIAAQYNAFALYHRHGVQNRNYKIRRPFADGNRFVDFNFNASSTKAITTDDNGLLFEFAENMDVALPSISETPKGFSVTVFFAPDEQAPEGMSIGEMEQRLPRRGIKDNRGVDYEPITIRAAGSDAFANAETSIALEAFRGWKISKSSANRWVRRPLEQQDFHAIISGLGSYPILMRRLGLLFDIQVSAEDLPTQVGQFELLVEPVFDPAANVGARPDLSVHLGWSACRAGEFVAETPASIGFRSFSMAPKDLTDQTTLGGLQVFNSEAAGPGHLIGHTFQDVDSITHKIIQKAVMDGAQPQGSGANQEINPYLAERRILTPGSPKTVMGAQDAVEIEGVYRQPASRSTGITLFVDRDGEKSISRYAAEVTSPSRKLATSQAQLAWPTDLNSAPVSYRDDVSAGLKIDVYMTGPDVPTEYRRWYSLTARQLKFNFLNNQTLGQYLAPADEGWIEKAGTSETDEGGVIQLRVNDYGFRWDQWSLSAPHPSRSAPELGDGSDGWERSIDLAVQAETVALSLAKLRYGRTYSFRGRIADLAGNSVHFDFANAAMPSPDADLARKIASTAITYRRHDPISPPVLYALQEPGPGSKIPSQSSKAVGPDQSDILVIRSGAQVPGSLGQAEWLVLPPDTDFAEAEWAGMLDGFSNPDDAFEVLERYDNELPKKYVPEFLKSIRWPNGSLGTPYLPDGYAAGATFRFMPGSGRTELSALPLSQRVATALEKVKRVSFNLRSKISGRYAPYAESFRLRLENGERGTTATKSGLLVTLPPGEQQLITISSYPDPERLDHFALVHSALESDGIFVVQLAAEALFGMVKGNDADIRSSLALGLHYPITPSKPVRLIHAVPKPVTVPKFSSALTVTNRVTGGNAIVMEDKTLSIHRASTGKIDIFAEWEEYSDLPGDSIFPRISRQRHACLSRDVPLPDTTIDPDGSHYLFDIGGRHGLPNNKHLQIKYRAVATTRYKEYFGDDITKDPSSLTVESEPSCELSIFNTSPPPPPQVVYILPLFLWSRKDLLEEGKAQSLSIRRRAGFRIYMRRGWFRTGKDETLAIVFQSDVEGAANKDPKLPPVPVTHWGSDPIWHDKNPVRRQPRLTDCLGAVHLVSACPAPAVYDPATPPVPSPAQTMCGATTTPCLISARDGVPLPPPILPAEILTGNGNGEHLEGIRTSDAYSADLPPEQELRVDIASYAVECDFEKDLLFADIEIQDVAAYMPFVRFAVARYQPQSAKYCSLSAIVLVDYVQLSPNRTVSIVRSTDSAAGSAKVTISGPAKGDRLLGYPENVIRVYRLLGDVRDQYPLEVQGEWLPAGSDGVLIFQWQFETDDQLRGELFLEEWEKLPGEGERIVFSAKIFV